MSAGSPQDCMSEFVAALIGRDIDAALLLLCDDVVLFYSNGSAIVGKAPFAAAMTANWQLIQNYSYSTLDTIWLAQSDTAAAVIYRFAWSGLVGGAEVSGGGRGTRVFRGEPGAGWRIVHEHLSTGQWGPAPG